LLEKNDFIFSFLSEKNFFTMLTLNNFNEKYGIYNPPEFDNETKEELEKIINGDLENSTKTHIHCRYTGLYYDCVLKYYKKAIEYFIKADELGCNNSIVNVAICYMDMKEYNEAEKYLTLALEKCKDIKRVYINFANLYFQQDMNEKALYYFLKLRDEYDHNYSHVNIGKILMKMNKYDEALESFKKSLEVGVNIALLGIGEIYLKTKQFDKIEEYEKLVKEHNCKDSYRLIVELMFENKDYNFSKVKEYMTLYNDTKNALYDKMRYFTYYKFHLQCMYSENILEGYENAAKFGEEALKFCPEEEKFSLFQTLLICYIILEDHNKMVNIKETIPKEKYDELMKDEKYLERVSNHVMRYQDSVELNLITNALDSLEKM
jgi:tetratricopeptide (TPR) repeat protein